MAAGRRENRKERKVGGEALSEFVSQGAVPGLVEHRRQARNNGNREARDCQRIEEAHRDRPNKRKIRKKRTENFPGRDTVIYIPDLQPS